MVRVAGLLFLAGSVMTVLAIAFPHSPKADMAGFWAIAAANAVVATLLLGWPERLPTWSFQAFMIFATMSISLSLYFNGERLGGPAADNEVLYLWIALYAGYFFTRTQMIGQLLVLCGRVCCGAPADSPWPGRIHALVHHRRDGLNRRSPRASHEGPQR
jgi:hypothetical protein